MINTKNSVIASKNWTLNTTGGKKFDGGLTVSRRLRLHGNSTS